MQEKIIFSYVNVKGDYLKNSNDNTKKLWEKCINDDFDEIIDITKSDDVEKQYRHMILTYNNNVWACNYWVGFIPFRPISKIFKIQKKKQINENSKEIK